MAQTDPHRQLAYAVQHSHDETNRVIASGRMKEINTGFEDDEYEVTWDKEKECFNYYYSFSAETPILL